MSGRVVTTNALTLLLSLVLVSPGIPTSPSHAERSGDGRAVDFDLPIVSVRRSEAARTIRVEISYGEESTADGRSARRRPKLGKIKVRNRSFDPAAIFWSLDDLFTPWFHVDTLPPGWKVKFKLPKKEFYLLAADNPLFGANDFWEWGPRPMYLKKRFKWTLLP
jgi:hypothetical protein